MTSQWEIKWKHKYAWLKLGKEKRKQSTNDEMDETGAHYTQWSKPER